MPWLAERLVTAKPPGEAGSEATTFRRVESGIKLPRGRRVPGPKVTCGRSSPHSSENPPSNVNSRPTVRRIRRLAKLGQPPICAGPVQGRSLSKTAHQRSRPHNFSATLWRSGQTACSDTPEERSHPPSVSSPLLPLPGLRVVAGHPVTATPEFLAQAAQMPHGMPEQVDQFVQWRESPRSVCQGLVGDIRHVRGNGLPCTINELQETLP